jgi:hypothetical protein
MAVIVDQRLVPERLAPHDEAGGAIGPQPRTVRITRERSTCTRGQARERGGVLATAGPCGRIRQGEGERARAEQRRRIRENGGRPNLALV